MYLISRFGRRCLRVHAVYTSPSSPVPFGTFVPDSLLHKRNDGSVVSKLTRREAPGTDNVFAEKREGLLGSSDHEHAVVVGAKCHMDGYVVP
jgi:hypothetical protein